MSETIRYLDNDRSAIKAPKVLLLSTDLFHVFKITKRQY